MKVRGFETNGTRKVCKRALRGGGKGGLTEEKGWREKGEKKRVGGTGGGD